MGRLKCQYLRPKSMESRWFPSVYFSTEWLDNDVGPPFSRLPILLTDAHPKLQSSKLSEAGYLCQVKLPTEVLAIKFSFVCYKSLSFLPAACKASSTACS